MSIRPIDGRAAVARLNSLRFSHPVAEVAALLAEWQIQTGGYVVPIACPLPRTDADGKIGPSFFRQRARLVRAQIAADLLLDAKAAERLTFMMTGKDAWYLGPRPKLDRTSMLAAVAAAPARFIELMLQRELIEAAAFDSEPLFVVGGFGPGAYLGNAAGASKRRIHLGEASFRVNAKHGQLVCNVVSKVFTRKKATTLANESMATALAETGEGVMLGIHRLVAGDFHEEDARKYPMPGLSLDVRRMRQTRLYYLNVLSEFARRLFDKAGVPYVAETFVASHCVDDAYIGLEPIASLKRPLMVVNASVAPMDDDALRPLLQLREFAPTGYHVAGGRKVHFDLPSVVLADGIPGALDADYNYLFVNAPGDDEHGSITIQVADGDELPVRAEKAYDALERGGRADPYTNFKFRLLADAGTVQYSMQGLDAAPAALAALRPSEKDNRALVEALKRCLVELSLKECLCGHKPTPLPGMPKDLLPAALTLLGTRQIRLPANKRKQLVAAVDVVVDDRGCTVERVRRTPWSDELAVIDMVLDHPFLQEHPTKPLRDNQFWAIDRATGARLRVWSGSFVPKIILNDDEASIESALAKQDSFLEAQRAQGGGRYYSKSQEFNLLPYYISMYPAGTGVRGERNGVRLPLQDCGEYLRLFVPPEGGISGAGDSLSGMRDIAAFHADGTVVQSGLLELRLVRLYLHTMTNGVLVGGDNSKMSVLEKLARLALEN